MDHNLPSDFDYRKIIRRLWDERRDKNPAYSLRALARDLKISSGVLSQLLNNKRKLKLKTAQHLAISLGFNESMQRLFIWLTELQNIRERAEELESRVQSFARPTENQI